MKSGASLTAGANQRPYVCRARGVLPNPEPSGISRQDIAAATESLRQSIQKWTESGGLAIPEMGACPTCRCLPPRVLCGRWRGVRMLSAYLPPFCDVCLVWAKKNGPNGFIVLIITQSFSRPRPVPPSK